MISPVNGWRRGMTNVLQGSVSRQRVAEVNQGIEKLVAEGRFELPTKGYELIAGGDPQVYLPTPNHRQPKEIGNLAISSCPGPSVACSLASS